MSATNQTPGSHNTAQSPPDIKPVIEDGRIHLTVRASDATQATFKVTKSTRLLKLLNAFAHKMGHDARTLRLLFDGELVGPDATGESFGAEDGDVFDVVLYQVGGAHIDL